MEFRKALEDLHSIFPQHKTSFLRKVLLRHGGNLGAAAAHLLETDTVPDLLDGPQLARFGGLEQAGPGPTNQQDVISKSNKIGRVGKGAGVGKGVLQGVKLKGGNVSDLVEGLDVVSSRSTIGAAIGKQEYGPHKCSPAPRAKPSGWHALTKQQMGSAAGLSPGSAVLMAPKGVPTDLFHVQETPDLASAFPVLGCAASHRRADEHPQMEGLGRPTMDLALGYDGFSKIGPGLACAEHGVSMSSAEAPQRSPPQKPLQPQRSPPQKPLQAISRTPMLKGQQASRRANFAPMLASAWQSAAEHDGNVSQLNNRSDSNARVQIVARLSTKFPDVECDLLSEVLAGVGESEELAEECLRGMGLDEESQWDDAPEDLEVGHLGHAHEGSKLHSQRRWAPPDGRWSSQSNGHPLEQSVGGTREVDGTVGRRRDAETGVPVEEDLYRKYRGEALRVSRARDRHARSAMAAFAMGDHARARDLSKVAREERLSAEALHAAAAEQILRAQNTDRPGGIWKLDLHGLHGSEAVAALQQRLEEIEDGHLAQSKPGMQTHGPEEISEGHKRNVMAASKVHVHRAELMVITGMGNHSHGGPTLPAVIRSFLVANGYTFRQARAGVIAVRPKIRLAAAIS